MKSEVRVGQQYGSQLTVIEAGEEFQRLRTRAMLTIVDRQHPGTIGGEGCHQGIAGGIQLAHVPSALCSDGLRGCATQQLHRFIDKARPPNGGTTNNGQEQIINEHGPAVETGGPLLINFTGKIIREMSVKRRLYRTAHNMMNHRKTGMGDRA